MAGGFIRKLLGGRLALPAEVEAALGELTLLAQRRPDLAGLAGELAEALPALYAEPIHDTPPVITATDADASLAGAVPLLKGATTALDTVAFGRRWRRITTALGRRRPDALKLVAGAVPDKIDPTWLWTAVLAGRPQVIHERAEALGLDVPLTASVAWLTLFPVLSHFRAGLDTVLRGSSWKEGYCPCCGGWPKLGEYRGVEQTRVLRCQLCAGEWTFPRLGCPFCGCADHRQLGYLHVEGEEGKERASTCEECRHYVKMLSTLSPLSPPGTLVADLATLHLDLAAADRGYLAPT
jgi:FdhE protein